MEARLDDMETRMGRIEKEVKRISTIEDSIKELRSEMKLMFGGLAQMIEELLQQFSLQHIPTTMMNAISSLKEFVAPNVYPSSVKQMETTRPPQVQLPGSQSLLYDVKSISHVSSHNGGFGLSTVNLDKSDLPILEITPSITTPTPMHLDFNTPPPPSPQYPPNLPHTFIIELSALLNHSRSVATQAKAPPQARQMGALKVSMLSPGIVYEPYAPREPISFLRRWFTRSGWRRTKDDIILELKSAYAIAKLRKSGYSKKQFYEEAAQLYKEINTLISDGDKTALRKFVTENMYSGLKNEIKQRESVWSSVYWELIEPIVKIRTLRARMIGVDRNDLSKIFVQLTLEILSKQKFEAYNSKGLVVAGDKSKEVLVRDIWVFEKSLFHQGAYWRLCGRISV
ncbi:hypothetical protein Syun_007716 [Stephania yunnanensis]|uniref:Large ribosomal subunit protein mL45 n=1 Tax=Stephania yunnanensis TaxID=152371 RepID=A0AAP0L017_9MAGN